MSDDDELLRLAGVDAAVRQVLGRYCRGIDRLDAELVTSCYHPGATDSHGSFVGPVEEFVPWALGIAGRHAVTFHFLGTVTVELDADDPDVAWSEAYATAYHRGEEDRDHKNLVTGIRYVDRFERRPVGDGPAAWRIADRVVVTDWIRHDPPAGWWPVPDGFPAGQRDRTDPVYTTRVHEVPGTS